MIKLQNMTPKVYYNQSRDFQFIGRLYDIILNSVKTNTELISSLPLNEDIDTKLLDLLTMTLGFKSIHEYNVVQLRALCSSFIEVLKNKGSLAAVEKACNILVNAEGITDEVVIEDVDYEKNHLTIYIPSGVKNTNLLKDLFDYILPAGMTYSLIKALITSRGTTTEIVYNDNVSYNLEYADRNADVTSELDDANKVNKNRISNIRGVILNSTVVDTSNMSKIKLETQGDGTIEFTSIGREWYTIGEPIKITSNKPISRMYFRINQGNDEEVNYTGSDNKYIINITKSTSWDWTDKPWEQGDVITITAVFE